MVWQILANPIWANPFLLCCVVMWLVLVWIFVVLGVGVSVCVVVCWCVCFAVCWLFLVVVVVVLVVWLLVWTTLRRTSPPDPSPPDGPKFRAFCSVSRHNFILSSLSWWFL